MRGRPATETFSGSDEHQIQARLFCQIAPMMLKSFMHLLTLRAQRGCSLPASICRRQQIPLPMRQFWLVILTLLLAANISPAQNKVLQLDGNGSYVELPPNIFNDLTQATVEVWAKWDEFRTYSRIFEFGAAWNSMSLFNHTTTSDLRYNLYPQNAKLDPSLLYSIRVPGLLRSNEWIHLAAVSGPRGMKL